jgi:hypothetical protein
MMKPAADMLNLGHTYTPNQFMLRRIYVLLSKFSASLTNNSSPSTGYPNKQLNTCAIHFSTAI